MLPLGFVLIAVVILFPRGLEELGHRHGRARASGLAG
jgi:hypothetical protein